MDRRLRLAGDERHGGRVVFGLEHVREVPLAEGALLKRHAAHELDGLPAMRARVSVAGESAGFRWPKAHGAFLLESIVYEASIALLPHNSTESKGCDTDQGDMFRS